MVAGEPARVPPNANSVSGEFHGQFQQPRRFRVWRHCHGARDRLIQLLAAALNDLQERQSAPGLIRAAAVVVVVIALPLLILTSCPANRGQQDVDEWLATGPTNRTKIRTFVVWTTKSEINTGLHLDAPPAKGTPATVPASTSTHTP